MAIQDDGKIVLAGQAGADFGVLRTHAQGDPDGASPGNEDFGGNGRVTTSFKDLVGGDAVAQAMIITDGGKILVAGYVNNTALNTDPTDDQIDYALAQYRTNGSLDPGFSGDFDGRRAFGNATVDERYYALARDPTSRGKFVAVGSRGNNPVFARHLANGNADSTFIGGGTGFVRSVAGAFRDVKVYSGGAILAAGFADDSALLYYFGADGQPQQSLRTNFGTTTNLSLHFAGTRDDSRARAILLRDDHKIVLGGYSHNGATNTFSVLRTQASGLLDTQFGIDGRVVTGFASRSYSAEATAVQQSDGKIVVVGSYHNGTDDDFLVNRYLPNGGIDRPFGTEGTVKIDFGSGNDGALAVAIDGDGKIVVAGYASDGTNDDIAVARLNSDGGIDTDFDTDARVTVDGGLGARANAVAIDGDGKIVVAGYATDNNNTPSVTTDDHKNFTIVRLNTDGSQDVSVTPDLGAGAADEAFAVAIDSNGKIVTAGYLHNGTDDDFAVYRVNSTDLSADTAFGDTMDINGVMTGTGLVTTGLGAKSVDRALALAVQSDNRIIVVGSASQQTTAPVVRYTDAGVIDATFSSDGLAPVQFPGARNAVFNAVTVQSNNKIIAAGYAVTRDSGPRISDIAVARLSANGNLDTQFGGSGMVRTNATGGADQARAVGLDSRNKIIVTGTADNAWDSKNSATPNNKEYLLARYLGQGPASAELSGLTLQT
ncbi:MAG: hypothetical protein OXB92_17110, partial [Acidimicrobiaceae bacterium]|nr:hypothetical protein [Acidimicrobiaceae bacterium]